MIGEVLDRVLDGELRRVIVNIPPRHSKSELFSRTLPGAYLARYPDRSVILCSYGAELAHDLSQDARDRYLFSGREVRRDSRAARNWRTASGGRMIAAGVRGPITGRGAHLAIIDDFYRDDEQASSPTVRRKTERWYDSVLYTRLEPDAAIVIVATRWHPADLVGWLMDQEDETPEGWTVISLPAISEATPQEFPDSVEVVPDFRTEPGLALCPERMPIDRLQHIKARTLGFFWSALWQNRPTAEEGILFRREWFDDESIFVTAERLPGAAPRVRSWDKAGTAGGGDWTVGVLWSRSEEGIYYVEDVIRGQWDDVDRERIIRQTSYDDNVRHRRAGLGNPVTIVYEVEPGSGGKQSASMTARALEGFDFLAERPVTNKVARARPMAAYFKAGQVRILRADWNRAFIDELVAFRDKNSQADQVDAAAQGFAVLANQAGDDLIPHRPQGDA